MPSKRETEKKKRDQREYHRRMRQMNHAHRMAHKLGGPFERIETYVEEVTGGDGQEPWTDREEIVAALENAAVAVGKAMAVLQAKPKSYVARAPKAKVKMKAMIGTIVAVITKYREDYGVMFDDEEMNRLVVASLNEESGRLFVRAPGDENGRPIPIRRSEVRVVEGGVPA